MNLIYGRSPGNVNHRAGENAAGFVPCLNCTASALPLRRFADRRITFVFAGCFLVSAGDGLPMHLARQAGSDSADGRIANRAMMCR
jgi:hypothetical protein